MSGTASVPNSFANAVTATGAQLDTNYTTVVAYLNDPTNRNNYAADGAATNTVNVTFSPPVVGGYTTGLELTWKWGVTNTGGVVLNANGLGNISVVNPDGSALQAGQGVAGSIGKGVYDGTRAIFLSPPSPASKAAMQAGTASASYITPALQNQHPSAAFAWGLFPGTVTGTLSVLAGYNVASIVQRGTGTWSVALTNSFATTNYVVIGAADSAGWAVRAFTKQTGGFLVLLQDSSATGQAATTVQFAAYGVPA